jgi:uncharacterized membrane protein YhhN
MRRLWIGFIPYIAVSAVHIGALAVGADELAGPTKLALMPLLCIAVVWGAWRSAPAPHPAGPAADSARDHSRAEHRVADTLAIAVVDGGRDDTHLVEGGGSALPTATSPADLGDTGESDVEPDTLTDSLLVQAGPPAGRPMNAPLTYSLLLAAIGFSWLGDGAASFFPALPTVPMMLLWFGLAHLCYIWLFWRIIPARRPPIWSAVYALWWVVLLIVLWPHLGALLVPVAIYGLVLGATAAGAARCHPLVAWGGALFLASDTVLAFRLFLPDAMPEWTSPLVMLTYCAGQGLIAAGVLVSVRARAERAGAAS